MARVDIFTPSYKKEERYSDVTIGFDKSPLSGNLARVTDAQSIMQTLKTLLLTNQGERLYNIDLGSKIRASLFDPLDDITASTIRTSITQAINNYEPRVNILQLNVIPSEELNAFKVNLFFNIINIPEVQQLNITLKRVR
jgi:phage baseplate assembly protein W